VCGTEGKVDTLVSDYVFVYRRSGLTLLWTTRVIIVCEAVLRSLRGLCVVADWHVCGASN